MSSVEEVLIVYKEVPQKIYFFWGNQKMSWMRYMTLYSFRKLNPEWEIELWVYDSPIKNKTWESEEQQDFFSYDGPDYFEEAIKLVTVKEWEGVKKTGPSHQSNLFKWYILTKYGGVYADMDILWLKPFDVFKKLKRYDVSLSCFDNYFSIGLLAATPGNLFFARVLEAALENYDKKEYQCLGVNVLYKIFNCWWNEPKLFEKVTQLFPRLRYFDIPKNWIYPARCFEMNFIFDSKIRLPDDCIGIHWYAGAEISQKWNNRLTENNVKEFSNTFCECVGSLIC